MTAPNVPLPTTFDEAIEHMIARHGSHFMSSGRPPTNPDEALEYQLESHDRLHHPLSGADHDHSSEAPPR